MTAFQARNCLATLSVVFLLLVDAGCAHVGASAATPKHYLITDYGAVSDGTTLNTEAIQKTIDAASAGKGVAVIPAGTFRSGSIFLKPDMEVYLEEGAVLLGSDNIEDYPKRETRIEGHFEPWRMALVNAQEMKNVRISGKGQINGNGHAFWVAFWQARRADRAVTNLGVERPRLMFIDRCENVRLEGLALQDSGFWNVHLYRCRDVLIKGIRITEPSGPAPGPNVDLEHDPIRAPSSDGLDIDSCQNVIVWNCYISCGDDNIALKGSKGPFAEQDKDSPPVENILVQNCEFGDGNGVITCGSEATIVRNVTVRNCILSGRTNLLTLKLRPDTPQHYSNITIDGIKLTGGQGNLLNVNSWGQFFDLQGQPGPAREVNNITIRNVTGDYGAFGQLRGNVANPANSIQGDKISGITLENINVNLARGQLTLGDVDDLTLKNVMVNGQPYELPAPAAP